MKLARTLFAAAALTLAIGAVPSQAAQFQTTPAGPAADGSLSLDFGNDGGIAAGAFTDTYTFTFPSSGTSSAAVFASFTAASNNLTFTSATLNGQAFTIGSGPGFNFASIEGATVGSTATLIVNGVSPGAAGSYAGHLSFSPSAVPEPATWALMIGGFGMVGGTMRRRAGKAVLA